MIKRFLFVLLLCASPCFAQLVLPSGTGVVQAPVDANGWLSYKLVLTQNVTSFSFAIIPNGTPPPSQAIRTVEFVEDSVGGRTVTFSSSISNPCSITITANAITICQFIFDSVLNTWAGLNVGGVPGSSPLPASTSGPGPVFNVKNYGAKGDTRYSVNASISNSTITCSDCNFTQADVGKASSMSRAGNVTIWTNLPITSVTNSTTASIAPNSFSGNPGNLAWGTIDDTAVSNAVTAWIAAFQQVNQGGVLAINAAAPVLYFPTGAYSLLNTQIFVVPGTPRAGMAIRGDGSWQSRIIALTGYVPTRLLVVANAQYMTVQGLTFDGMGGTAGVANNVLDIASGQVNFIDVVINNFAGSGLNLSTPGVYLNGVVSQNNAIWGLKCDPCSGEIENTFISNNTQNIQIVNTTGSPGSFSIKLVTIEMDECGTDPCMVIQNSQDIWFVGGNYLGEVSVDGTSSVHFNGGVIGRFNQSNNGTALLNASGGIVEASDMRFISTGTGKCINNSGTFINNGGNTCESQFFTISAAASAGTTATLTVTTQGANVNAVCGVGDSVYVQNVGVAGYNGFFKNLVTAVGTNTVAYTTPGSNLGASSGGSVFCRSYLNYSGTLPYSTITPTPNTCYVTGTFAAITLCNQFIDRGINIYHIKASSGVTTACTVAPVVTISDGTNSATLTITTAKATWDSSVDASTNVGNTIYTPHGGTLTVSTTAGTCTTPPTNFALTYTMQGVMDN